MVTTRAADVPPVLLLAALGGGALAVGLNVVGVLRRDKPLHAFGVVTPGRLVLDGTGTTGSPVLDAAATLPVQVRLSKAASVSCTGPDVLGVALRVAGAGRDGGDADVLFASTFVTGPGRYVLAVRRRVADGPLTTLLPQRSPRGLVVLRLDPQDPGRFVLGWSGVTGPWTPIGVLELDDPGTTSDRPLRFDPVGRPLAGLEPPLWVRLLRNPAYSLARGLSRPGSHRRAQVRRLPAEA